MLITGNLLFAFVDPKDPFTSSEVAGEEQPGPILSILCARRFDHLFLFHTPHTVTNAGLTCAEVAKRHPACHVHVHDLPVSDPKDYSALMGRLARQVRDIVRESRNADNYVCASSGTAEMRAAWFLLTAVGVLPAKLLQVGSPASPLFGSANVKEVDVDQGTWADLRDLIMPLDYFAKSPDADMMWRIGGPTRRVDVEACLAAATGAVQVPVEPRPELEDALKELEIFVGSAVLRQAAEKAAIAAGCDAPVLLLGETGTGKELFARLIHRLSSRNSRDLIPVNCAAIPKELAESYLFGHLRGAFTGAAKDHRGVFEHADGSTLFLDEIGELTLDVQAKLLRVLQDGELKRLGTNSTRKVDVRVIAATNRNLQAEVTSGRFREDLYYRLEVLQIQLPALRDRRAEISELAVTLLKQMNQRRPRPKQLSKDALRRLEQHSWPGNVRELSNVIQRSVLYAPADVIGPDDLIIIDKGAGADPFAGLPDPEAGFSLEDYLKQVRKQLILRALAKTNNNHSAAAELLGLSKQAVSKFVAGAPDNQN